MTERTANDIWAGATPETAPLLWFLGRTWETLVIWRQRARDRAEIGALDARGLQDMGIAQADAWRETRKPFWQG